MVGSWRGRTVRFRCYSFLSFCYNETHRVSGNPAAKRCQVTFVVATKKVLAASNPFSGNKSPWCWQFFGKKQGSGFLSHKKVKVTLVHSRGGICWFDCKEFASWILKVVYEVAALYGSLWPKHVKISSLCACAKLNPPSIECDVQLTSSACDDHWIRFRTQVEHSEFWLHNSWADIRVVFSSFQSNIKRTGTGVIKWDPS